MEVTRILSDPRRPRTFGQLVKRWSADDRKAVSNLFRRPPTDIVLFRPRMPKGKVPAAPDDALLYAPSELESPEVLSRVLGSALDWAENKPSSAFSAAELEKEVSGKPGTMLRRALERAFETGLPSGFGAVRRSGTWVFLRVDRLVARREGVSSARILPRVPPSSVSPDASKAAESFSSAFDAAFDRLNALHRGLNFVKLKDLRDALPNFERSAFDAGLRALRIAARYDLTPNEGTHLRLSAEEREAGIVEAGARLVICRRIDPSER